MHEIFVWITYRLPDGNQKTDCIVAIGGTKELRTALESFKSNLPEGTELTKAAYKVVEQINMN